jgi:hypothetical protein
MADVSQNIGAQLFVKELPAAFRADFTGCKQDFNSGAFTTCVNYLESDADIENAFQKQLNLSEYYKSPEVFETLKQNYMMKTMESHFETEPVNLNPDSGKNDVPIQQPDLSSMVQQNIKDSGIFTKSTFGAMENSNIILFVIVLAILFYFFKNK